LRIVVLAANIYSERALATLVALHKAGFTPIACVCLSTLSLSTIVRKLAQYGPKNFVLYVVRRLNMFRGGRHLKQFQDLQFDNPYLEHRLKYHNIAFSDVASACTEYNIHLCYCKDVNSEKVLSFLRKFDIDLIVYAGGGILRNGLIKTPKIGVLNAHGGILPEYRGMNVMEWSLLQGDQIGVTVHFIDSKIDTGQICFVNKVPVSGEDGSITALRNRIVDTTVDALVEAVRMLAKGEMRTKPQAPEEGKQYFTMHEKLLELAELKLNHIVDPLLK